MTAAIDEKKPAAPDTGQATDEDLEKLTELEKFGPERMDGVGQPATGIPALMLKGLGTGTATAPSTPTADTSTTPEEGHITDTATATPEPDAAAAATQAAKSTPATETVNVDLPAGASVSMSPADLAKLATLKQQLVLDQAAKRDMDPDVGGGVDRDKLPASAFVFPETRDFPVVTPADVPDAVSSWGRYKGSESFQAFKASLTALARRKGKAFTSELPKSWRAAGGDTEKARGKGGKPGKGGKKPFPGAAPPFKAKDGKDDEAGGENSGDTEDGDGEAAKACGCGRELAKCDRFCSACGTPATGDAAAKAAQPSAEDARVNDAIGELGDAAGAALAAQAADPDAETHPADTAVTAHLQDAQAATAAAAAAQEQDVREDNPAEHAAAKSADPDGPVYHLRRLHDATCAAFTLDDVVASHPAVSKGIGAVTDPAAIGAMVSAALTEDAGTGSRAADLPGLSGAYQAAVALKAASAHDGLLDEAMDSLRKAFSEYYPDAHPKPGAISPGQFTRPYISAGHARQSAAPGQSPRIPLATHVPDPADFRRPLITAGREATAPGTAVGKRTYYTNTARDQANTALAAMHDYIAGSHPTICPMAGVTPDGEPAIPNTMGSTLTTAIPVTEQFAGNQARSVPVPVAAAHAASVVAPGPGARKDKDTKKERKMAKAATRAAEGAAAAPQAPVIDAELLKSTLREIVAEQLGDVVKTIGDLPDRVAALESAPDPAQMTPRAGAGPAAIIKAKDSGPEVPAGGDGPGTERVMRLMKRTQDPDGGVRVAAIGELTELVGRETAAELLAAT